MIILAGGRATRLGGADKPGLTVGGRSLLDAVLAAGTEAGARQAVIVGPSRPGVGRLPGGPPVRFVREEPPGAGPVPALRRGLDELGHPADPGDPAAAPWLAVLAADLPFLRAAHLRALLAAAAGHAGAGHNVPVMTGPTAMAPCSPTTRAGRSGWPAAGGPRRCGTRPAVIPARHCTGCWPRCGRPSCGSRPARGSRRPGWTATPKPTCAAPAAGQRTGQGASPGTTTLRSGSPAANRCTCSATNRAASG